MRQVLALLLCSHLAFGAAAFDATAGLVDGYAGAGVHNITVTPTAGDTNIAIVVHYFSRGGTISGTPTVGGNNMTQVVAGTSSGLACFAPGNSAWWIYFGGTVGSGNTVSFNSSVESQLDGFVFTGVQSGGGTGGSDATASFIANGTSTSGSFGAAGTQFPLPITIATTGAIMIGTLCDSGSVAGTPATATYIGADGTGFGLRFWYSNPNPSAGSFTLYGYNTTSTVASYMGNGFAMKPFGAASNVPIGFSSIAIQ